MIEIAANFTNSVSKLKKDYSLRKLTSSDKTKDHENKFWIMLFQLDFSSLNIDGDCCVKFGKKGRESQKNVDVIGESNEIKIYVECTTQKGTLIDKIKSWIVDVTDIRKWEKTNNPDKNIVFVFHTTDSITNPADKKRLKDNGIVVFDNSLIDYYKTLASQSKRLSYFQLLSYLCSGQEIKSINKDDYKVPAIKAKFGSKDDYCYLFAIKPYLLIPISTVPHRKGDIKNENYQRIIKKTKINSLKKHIKEKRGVFPTNIVINVDVKNEKNFFSKAAKDNNLGYVSLPPEYGAVSVIDGQHRLFSYDSLEESKKDLIYVIAFINLDSIKQVNTFIDINRNQTKVSSSLLWDLYPTISRPDDVNYGLNVRISLLAKKLNSNVNSSLYGVISYDSSKIILDKKLLKYTLESVCTAIKKSLIIKWIETNISEEQNINDENDKIAFDLISCWFEVIKNYDSNHWEIQDKTLNYYLSNQGFGSLIKLFKLVIKESEFFKSYNGKSQSEVKNKFQMYLDPVLQYVSKIDNKEDMRNLKGASEAAKTETYLRFIKLINKSDDNLKSFGEDELKKEPSEKIQQLITELNEQDENRHLEIKEAFFADTRRFKETNKLVDKYDGFSKLNDSDMNKNQISGILKSVVAFANSYGGRIVIGISDPDHVIVGIDSTDLAISKNDNKDKYKRRITSIIEEHTDVDISALEFIFYNNKTLLEIKISPIPTQNLTGLGLKKFKEIAYYRAVGPKNVAIKLDDFQSIIHNIKLTRKDLDNSL